MESVAIVTGASAGIGKATAIRLAREFGRIVLAARSEEQLQQTAQAVRAAGAEPLVVALDLGAGGAADAVVGETLQRFGRIDALVNIAGAVPGLDVFEMSDAQWEEGFALKFHGARRLTVRAWDALKASKGSVVFVSGVAANAPRPGGAAVAAINAAIEALSKAFAERGVADGVQVNTVSPGAIITARRLGMLEKAAQAQGIALDAMKAKFLETAGIARFGTPEEVAELMAFATSAAARWMTGTVLRMDGGEIKTV